MPRPTLEAQTRREVARAPTTPQSTVPPMNSQTRSSPVPASPPWAWVLAAVVEQRHADVEHDRRPQHGQQCTVPAREALVAELDATDPAVQGRDHGVSSQARLAGGRPRR